VGSESVEVLDIGGAKLLTLRAIHYSFPAMPLLSLIVAVLLNLFVPHGQAAISYGDRIHVDNMGGSFNLDWGPIDPDVQVYFVAKGFELRATMPEAQRKHLYLFDAEYIQALDQNLPSFENALMSLKVAAELIHGGGGDLLGSLLQQILDSVFMRQVIDILKHEEAKPGNTYTAHRMGQGKEERAYFLANMHDTIKGVQEVLQGLQGADDKKEADDPEETFIPNIEQVTDDAIIFNFGPAKISYGWDIVSKNLMAVPLESRWDNLDPYEPSRYANSAEASKGLNARKKAVRSFIKSIYKKNASEKARFENFFGDTEAGWVIAATFSNFTLKHPDMGEALFVDSEALSHYDKKTWDLVLHYPESLMQDKANWANIALFHWVSHWASSKSYIYGAPLWDRYYLKKVPGNDYPSKSIQVLALDRNHALNTEIQTPMGEKFAVTWDAAKKELNFEWINAPRAVKDNKKMSMSLDEAKTRLGAISLTEMREFQKGCQSELF
jgi:hypothetical protein